jgi:hypothetical protein
VSNHGTRDSVQMWDPGGTASGVSSVATVTSITSGSCATRIRRAEPQSPQKPRTPKCVERHVRVFPCSISKCASGTEAYTTAGAPLQRLQMPQWQ